MLENDFKQGDAVLFEYRDKYDRETGTGIVVEVVKDNRYKVALIQQENQKWFWTNYWELRTADRLKPVNKKVEDYGLKIK